MKLNNQYHNIGFIGVKKVLGNNQIAFNIRGSGFVLKKDEKRYLITCAHVYQQIAPPEKTSIFCGLISNDTRDSKTVKKYNFYDLIFVSQHQEPRRDICLFEIKATDIDDYGFDLSDLATENDINNLKPMDSVIFEGFPLGNEFLQMNMGITLTVSQTIISATKYNNQDTRIDFILIDKLVNPGSSGSPVFHEIENKIIGIASGTINQAHRIGETLINVPVNIGLVRTSNYIIELFNSLSK